MMKSKGEWFERFKEFRAFVETQSEHEIKTFRWMRGGDSISKDFEVFWMENDIESTPQDIGLAEVANQIVAAMAKRMFKPQKLKKLLWTEVVENAVYILN